MGYHFNAKGQLRTIKGDVPCDINPKLDPSKYSQLGEIVTEYVYDMLVNAGLQRINIESAKSNISSFVFSTKSSLQHTKKLLFLVNGSGHVRAGQWARSLTIFESLDHGTQMPYITRAMELGYDVVVANTNCNVSTRTGAVLQGYGAEHLQMLYDKLLAPQLSSIDSFYLVAHSAGGQQVLNLLKQNEAAFFAKCFGICFTDSPLQLSTMSKESREYLSKNSRNYVTSKKTLNTMVKSGKGTEVPEFSAGHNVHEHTSYCAKTSIFGFFGAQYSQVSKVSFINIKFMLHVK